MHIYESTLEYLRMIGLSWNQLIQKYPINERNLISLFIFGLDLVCNVGYLICGAKDLKNVADSLLATFTVICVSSILISLIWKMKELFEFYSRIDDIVAQSKRILSFFVNFEKAFFIRFMWSFSD